MAGSRYVFCIEDVWSVRPANKARVIWVRHLRKRKPENSTLIACARPGTGKVRFRRNRWCIGRKLHMPLRRAKDEAQQQQCVEWRSYGSSGARSAANPGNLRSAPGSFGDPPAVMLTAQRNYCSCRRGICDDTCTSSIIAIADNTRKGLL